MPFSYYIKLLISTLILGAILIAVQKLSKTIYKKKYTGEIKIVDRLLVDANISLLIIDIRSQQYLLSVGGKEIKFLRKI